MTDDEIDAALDALIPDGTIIKRRDAGRLIYRAGMREAARIARELALKFVEPVCEIAAVRVAAAIERAAGGEG